MLNPAIYIPNDSQDLELFPSDPTLNFKFFFSIKHDDLSSDSEPLQSKQYLEMRIFSDFFVGAQVLSSW